jgi:hypothetical protein
LSEEDLRPNPIASARDKTSISRKYWLNQGALYSPVPRKLILKEQPRKILGPFIFRPLQWPPIPHQKYIRFLHRRSYHD